MSKWRKAARVDSNQPEIVKSLRRISGVTVKPGHDDILVGYNYKTYWFELKSGRAVSQRNGKILNSCKKESQLELEQKWTGHYKIVSSLNEILSEIGII